MRNLVRPVWIALVVAGCAKPTPAPPQRGALPQVVVISIDGMKPDTFLDPDAHGLAVPTLRALAARGPHARVTPVLPSSTYPAHTTIVTGVEPAVHGITTNRPPDGLDNNPHGWRWYAEDIRVPTLWQLVEAQDRAVALVTWPVTVGADVTWRVPEWWSGGGPDDQKHLRALSTPGLLDAVEAETPGLWDDLVPPDVHDAAQFAIARHLLTHERVDLLMMHVWQLDDAQHAHGAWSPEAIEATERVDGLLGELLAVLGDDTIVVVLSDHGFAPVTTQIRLEALFVERGLVSVDAEGKPIATRVTLNASGGVAYLYLDDASARADLDAALAAAGPEAIAQILGPDEIAARGGDPDADYLLVAPPGAQFSERRAGPVIQPATAGGDHGMLPDDPEMLASFLAVGPGLEPADLGTIPMTDVGPMLARWLGVELGGLGGR